MTFADGFLNGGVRKDAVGSVLPDSTNEPRTTILSLNALRRLALTVGRIRCAVEQAAKDNPELDGPHREIGGESLANVKDEVNDNV